MKLILKEAPFDFEEPVKDEQLDINTPDEELEVKSPLELPVEEPTDEEVVSNLELDATNSALAEFINSDELNELRDIFIEYDLNNDVEICPKLLLLNNNLVVIAQEGNEEPEDDNTTFLYCLGDDDNEFSLVPLPNSLDNIVSNNSIIQYTPSNISDVHDKVVELFMSKLTGEDVEEPIEEPIEDTIPEPEIELPTEEPEGEEPEEEEVEDNE